MQSGIITSASIGDILRGVSQKRRQGLMEINLADSQILFHFVQGKVTDIFDAQLSGPLELEKRLVEAGILEEPLSPPAGAGYSEYYETLRSSGKLRAELNAERFRQIVKHRVLERLYSLELGGGAYYTFKVQMVEADREFAPSISVGQILLDLVELQTEKSEFDSQFPPESVVSPGEATEDLSDEERNVMEALSSPMTIVELEKRSLLSSFHFRHAMLELARRGLVLKGGSVQAAGEGFPASTLTDDLFASLDGAIDAAFAAEGIGPDEGGESAAADGDTDGDEVGPGGATDDDLSDYSRASRMNLLNVRLLQATWIPNVILGLFLVSALVVPILMWHSPGR